MYAEGCKINTKQRNEENHQGDGNPGKGSHNLYPLEETLFPPKLSKVFIDMKIVKLPEVLKKHLH